MNKQFRKAGLIFSLSLILGFGIWQQHSQAAEQMGKGLKHAGSMLKQLFTPAATAKPVLRRPPPAVPARFWATITVQSLGDSPANATNCPGANCRLRDALAAAGTGDTIDFAVTGSIALTAGELLINKNLTINGPGPSNLTISGNGASRVFLISTGVTVALNGLTIANGNGGGVSGGGVRNLGTLSLTNCTLSGNSVNAAGGGGGAIYSNGSLTMLNSALANNAAGSGNGGGILNQGTLTLANSTLTGNSAAFGGGLFNSSGTATLTHCTIAANTVSSIGGGVYNSGGTLNSRNTLIAQNTSNNAADVFGTLSSLGYNLIGNTFNTTITGVTIGNLLNVNPALGALGNYGGATATYALLPGSPAMDAGDNCVLSNSCASQNLGFNLTTDQRGGNFSRQANGQVDIGAFEFQGYTCAITVTNPVINSGTNFQPFSQTFTQTGGTPGATYFGTTSTLPTGLSLNSNGTLSGTPTQAGTFPITVVAYDTNNCGGSGQTYNLVINCVTQVQNNNDSGAGSLRQTIADTCSGSTITFASGISQITLTSGELLINKNLTIQGAGVTISGNSASRVFLISTGVTVALNGLTIANGNGGGVSGGGVRNLGTLSLTNCTLSGNSVNAAGGGGGAIYSNGSLTMLNSALAKNAAGSSNGGGIFNQGTLTLANSTLTGNSAAFGGGLFNSSGTATLTHCTIAANTVSSSGGGVYSSGGTLNSRNTLIAQNTSNNAADVFGTLNSLGYNLIGNTFNTTVSGVTTGNLLNVSPGLGVFWNLGGATATYALLPGSPALDAGDNCVLSNSCASQNLGFNLTTDQRGGSFSRQANGQVDIGAFEFQGYTCAITVTNPVINSGALAQPFSQTFTQTGGAPGGTFWGTVSALPIGLSLNSNGTLSGTPTQGGSFPIKVVAYDTNNCGGSGQTYNLVINCPTVTLATPAAGVVNRSYTSSVAAAPVGLAYQYTLANSTTLPPGLNLNASTGAITGTPSTAGVYNFEIKAEIFNGATTTGCAVTQPLSITTSCATVTNNNDSGVGSLRQALVEACPGSTITFASGISQITLTSGELAINKNLTISGPGSDGLTISGNGTSRVFTINVGITAALNGLTITNGNGGGALISGLGGGILNFGTLSLNNCALSGNSISGTGNGGGAIYNGGTLTMFHSTLSGNSAGSNNGGGINSFGPMTLANSTLSGNSASNGGGLFRLNGSAVLINCTISSNTATSFGGGVNANGGLVSGRNTLIALNNSPNGADYYGTLNSQGYNLIGDASNPTFTIITAVTTGNVLNVNPRLGPLANHGGLTQTHPLLPGSPALNAGNNCVLTNSCTDFNLGFNLITDQRGGTFNRQLGSAVDIGAFESGGFTLALAPSNSGNNQSASANTNFANPLRLLVTALVSGEPVLNGRVTFTPPASGASAIVAGSPATIDASGLATTGMVTANSTIGSYNVAATTAGATGNVNFNLTNTFVCPLITGAITGGGTICTGGSATVTVTVTGGTAPYTVVLNNGGGTQIGAGPVFTFSVSPGATTTYSLAAGSVDANGCPLTGSGSATVTFNPTPAIPAIIAGGPTTFCAGGSVTLTSSSAIGNQWYRNGSPISGATNQTYSATLTGNYTVIVTTSGCASASSAATSVTVTPTPATPTITAGGATTFCEGGSVTLTSSSANGNQWYRNGSPISGATSQTYSATQTGSYTVVVTTNSCPSVASAGLSVTVNPTPATPSITPGGPTTICQSGSVLLTSSSATGNQWYLNGNPINGATGQTYNATTLGNYTVVTVANGCNSAPSLAVNVTANTAPTLVYGNVSVTAGGAAMNSPTTATDNGTITGYAVQSQGTYTGTISVNASGVVSISAAAPVGTHTITIRATDNCGATTDATFTLTVSNNAPTITAGTALTRQRGSAGTLSTIATVGDTETPVGSLVVTVTTVPAGITLTSITNTAGTITATVAASCTATIGANTVVLTVTDGNSGTATANLTVNVTANSSPTLTYSNASVNAGTGTTVNPATGPTDNGSVSTIVVQSVSPPTVPGTISVNASGVVTVPNNVPAGTYTITIRATDNCGATTDAPFTLTVSNTPPSFAPATALSRQQGSTAGAAVTIGTVSDVQTAAGSLTVTQIAGGTATGITVSSITNTSGTVTAVVTASCTATPGTVRFQVSDGTLTGTGDLTVNVTANTPPSVTYANASVNAGGSTSNSPTTATDNGSITGYAVQSQGTYTGTISVNAAGVVSISAAAPVGTHTITIRATDNCGATTDATFTLTVSNNAPTITAGGPLTRQQGTVSSVSTIATVGDVETAAGNLVVTATTVPAGLTLTAITNTAGTITANVAAGCAATLGNNTIVLTVTDGNSGSTTANLTVNVTTNMAPTLTYGGVSVNAGASTTNSPTAATDNGSITGYAVQSQGTYTGTISVNASGVVSISAAAPAGAHTITIRATDNCGATTDATFTLTVNCASITVTNPAITSGIAGVAFSQSFTQAGSTAPVSFSLASGTLPAGLSLATNGTLSGTPTQAGSFPLTVMATDANNCTGTGVSYHLVINCPTITVSPSNATLPTGRASTPYAQTFTQAGGNGAITWSVSAGALPAGLTLSTGGVLSGSPTVFGTFGFTVRATDLGLCTGERAYTLLVNPPCGALTVNPTSLPNGTQNTSYSQTLTATGGTSPYTFAVTAGALPNGLTLASGGALTGTPTTTGTFNFTVTATDNTGCTGTRAYTVSIAACTITLTPTGRNFSSAAASSTVAVTATSCAWTATSNAAWLTLTGTTTGTGNATLNYNVAANAGASRTGTISVNGVTHTVFQATADTTQDSDGDGIPDSVEITESRDPLVKDNDIFTNNRLFVMQQYRDFLGREGDPGGITNWVNALNSNTLTKAQVIESFFNSAEFQNTGAPIVRLYFAYFLRIPDYAGLQNWINAYRGGMTLDAISNAFAGSAEFIQTYGSLNNTQFVTLVYNNVLGRAPDQAGLNNWVNALNNGMSRGTMMLGFSESQEYRNRSGNWVYVTMMYVGMLRRSPEQAGFDNWVAYLNAGNSALDLINGFIGAQEYHNRFLP